MILFSLCQMYQPYLIIFLFCRTTFLFYLVLEPFLTVLRSYSCLCTYKLLPAGSGHHSGCPESNPWLLCSHSCPWANLRMQSRWWVTFWYHKAGETQIVQFYTAFSLVTTQIIYNKFKVESMMRKSIYYCLVNSCEFQEKRKEGRTARGKKGRKVGKR